jgi:hypothetical protein
VAVTATAVRLLDKQTVFLMRKRSPALEVMQRDAGGVRPHQLLRNRTVWQQIT